MNLKTGCRDLSLPPGGGAGGRASGNGSSPIANDTTSPLVEEANAYYRELLRPTFEGRKFLAAGPVAVGLGGLARQLLALGADRPFLIAGNAGTGAVPGPDEAELRVLGLRGGDILIEHRNLHRALENLPPDVQAAVETWDPAGAARFLFADPLASHLPWRDLPRPPRSCGRFVSPTGASGPTSAR